jgi:putative hemolysin
MTAVPQVDAQRSPRRLHIVDELIEERAPHLAASPLWPVMRPLLYALLDYGRARRMADAIAPMGGRQAMDYASGLLSLKVETANLERLPVAGRVVLVCNHPTGIADGIAVYDALKQRRPDLCFFANADAFRVCPGLEEVVIPVEWVIAKRTRERTRATLVRAREALEAERALIVFPAGRLARHRPGRGLVDEPWASSAVSLARRHGAPLVPMHLSGPYARLFHLFDKVSDELRDITLFHELLNKRGRTFQLKLGPLVAPDALEGDAQAVSDAIKAYIERVLPHHRDRPFA